MISIFFQFTLFLVCLFVVNTSSNLPVVVLHGFWASADCYYHYEDVIKRYHKGTDVFLLEYYPFVESGCSLFDQVSYVHSKIQNLKKEHGFSKFHLIGHSQGGLIGRILLQLDNNTVENFISLAGIQMGSFHKEIPTLNRAMLPLEIRDIPAEDRHIYYYTPDGQNSKTWGALANIFNDPFHREEYFANNTFLPYFNNMGKEKNPKFRENLLNTKKIYLIVSETDDYIEPWQAGHFGFFKDGSGSEIVDLFSQELYKQDVLGLKTLYEEKRLELVLSKNVSHLDWFLKEQPVVDYVLPLLD